MDDLLRQSLLKQEQTMLFLIQKIDDLTKEVKRLKGEIKNGKNFENTLGRQRSRSSY